ncbi:MAG TPA: WbqC family protein [Pyrinomonadaceae bacterium]|nr:WbqC family protein [Pyrinomonadaceae bacterium]
MKLAIMQPYFMPYIGYWQLMNAVDEFVVYDNVKYTKKGWINRNRLLMNEVDLTLTIHLQGGSDFLPINERFIAQDFDADRLLRKIDECYRKAPFYKEVLPLVRDALCSTNRNLFEYVLRSIRLTAGFLGIDTKLIVSSSIGIDHGLRGKEKVIEICRHLGAVTYVNAIGGQSLYDRSEFAGYGIDLRFLATRPIVYRQFSQKFLPSLSIIDVLMFNSVESTRSMLEEFDLV